ncbi:SDR family oxidoreductase [Nocardioides zeae]
MQAAIVNTVSASGTTHVLPGQAAYAAAKAGIAALTLVSAAELGRIGVRVNAVAPGARTRMTSSTPGAVGELMAQPVEPGQVDVFDPAQASPLVVHLAAASTDVTGRVFAVRGGAVEELVPWQVSRAWALESTRDWTVADVADGFRRQDARAGVAS